MPDPALTPDLFHKKACRGRIYFCIWRILSTNQCLILYIDFGVKSWRKFVYMKGQHNGTREKSVFAEPLFSNQISHTRFLEPDFANQISRKLRAQNKRVAA